MNESEYFRFYAVSLEHEDNDRNFDFDVRPIRPKMCLVQQIGPA